MQAMSMETALAMQGQAMWKVTHQPMCKIAVTVEGWQIRLKAPQA